MARWTGPPAEAPHDYAALFTIERSRLTGLLARLRAADWERPSPCPGWSVLGLCCHLLGDDLGSLARHRDDYLGTPGPPGATEAEFAAWLEQRGLLREGKEYERAEAALSRAAQVAPAESITHCNLVVAYGDRQD